MDTSDKNTEHTKKMMENKRVEQRNRQEAHRAAESRRSIDQNTQTAERKPESQRHIEKGAEKKVQPARSNANDMANARKREHSEGKKDSKRFEELALKKNLSGSERKDLQGNLESTLDKTDPHWKEADRRTREGEKEFKNNAKARREFCHAAGTEEHKRWEKEQFQAEQKVGHVKGEYYGIEAVYHHSDGKPVRLDYVDYHKDIIIDRKPKSENETEEQLKKKYEKQRQRHIEAYEHSTGRKVLEYRYSLYPSPKD
jgi:hypothetical protein